VYGGVSGYYGGRIDAIMMRIVDILYGVLLAVGLSVAEMLHRVARPHDAIQGLVPGLGLGGNESYPDLFQPYGGFPDGVPVENGHVTMPDLPGIGL